ncbi:MAG: universal stress protein [Hyphomicrobiales bacterium]|nr:universal stress protein [Hyphomicrobiales bacterium]
MLDFALVVDAQTKEAGAYALSLAKLMDAHLTSVPTDIESALADQINAELRYDLILAEQSERREAIERVAAEIASQGLAAGLPVDSLRLANAGDNAIEALERALRVFDLNIVEQAYGKRGEARPRMIETMVFDVGRPVLIIPYIQTQAASLRSALVAWDGSAPAARALGDAVPILKRADRVEVVRIGGKESERQGGALVTRHLARHGIDAVFKQVPSSKDVGNTLLSHAVDVSADFLVMGAFGHSRLREAIFGGATRTLLHSMTLPVLLSR